MKPKPWEKNNNVTQPAWVDKLRKKPLAHIPWTEPPVKYTPKIPCYGDDDYPIAKSAPAQEQREWFHKDREINWPADDSEVGMAILSFVREYLVDFNMAAAAMRYGFPESCAAKKGEAFFKLPYFQHLLRREILAHKESTLCSRNQVIAWLVREANSYGPDANSASRVSALARLAKVLGMEVVRVEMDIDVAQSVMQVPMATPEEWEMIAQRRQEVLKSIVRN